MRLSKILKNKDLIFGINVFVALLLTLSFITIVTLVVIAKDLTETIQQKNKELESYKNNYEVCMYDNASLYEELIFGMNGGE